MRVKNLSLPFHNLKRFVLLLVVYRESLDYCLTLVLQLKCRLLLPRWPTRVCLVTSGAGCSELQGTLAQSCGIQLFILSLSYKWLHKMLRISFRCSTNVSRLTGINMYQLQHFSANESLGICLLHALSYAKLAVAEEYVPQGRGKHILMPDVDIWHSSICGCFFRRQSPNCMPTPN